MRLGENGQSIDLEGAVQMQFEDTHDEGQNTPNPHIGHATCSCQYSNPKRARVNIHTPYRGMDWPPWIKPP